MRRHRLIPVVAILALVLSFLGSNTQAVKASPGITLRILSRHDTTITSATKAAFLDSPLAKQYEIDDLQFYGGLPQQWVGIIENLASRELNIDVGWGGGPTLFDQLNELELLAPLSKAETVSVVNALPDKIGGIALKRFNSEGQAMWVAAAISSFGFTTNSQTLSRYNLPAPEKWSDLASPTYAKLLPATPVIGTADAPRSTSNTRMFHIMLQANGWDKGWNILTRLGANARIYDTSDAVREGCISGELGAGTTIDFYGYTAVAKTGGICKYVIPPGESIINGDPIALMKDAKNADAAQAFIQWVLEIDKGQQIWLNPEINRLPIDPGVFDTAAGQGRPDLRAAYEEAIEQIGIDFDDALALNLEQTMMAYFHATITEAQSTLQRAWKMMVDAKDSGEITEAKFNELVEKLGNPQYLTFRDPNSGQQTTLTIEYAIEINQQMVSPSFLSEMTDEWVKGANARYQAVMDELLGVPPTTTVTTTPTTITTSTAPTAPTSVTTSISTSPVSTTTAPTTTATTTYTTPTTPTTTRTTTSEAVAGIEPIWGVAVIVVIVVVALIVVAMRRRSKTS